MHFYIAGRGNAANSGVRVPRSARALNFAAACAMLGLSLPLAAQAPARASPAVASSTPAAPLPAAAFAKIPFVEDVVMSPGGDRMAGSSASAERSGSRSSP
jgi:hypothetical protein